MYKDLGNRKISNTPSGLMISTPSSFSFFRVAVYELSGKQEIPSVLLGEYRGLFFLKKKHQLIHKISKRPQDRETPIILLQSKEITDSLQGKTFLELVLHDNSGRHH